MDITCDKCQSKFKIPDEKIPAGKEATLRCPKCKEKITIEASQKPNAPEETPQRPEMSSSEVASEAYDASDKPHDFIE